MVSSCPKKGLYMTAIEPVFQRISDGLDDPERRRETLVTLAKIVGFVALGALLIGGSIYGIYNAHAKLAAGTWWVCSSSEAARWINLSPRPMGCRPFNRLDVLNAYIGGILFSMIGLVCITDKVYEYAETV